MRTLGAVIVTYRSGHVLPGLLESLRRWEPDAVVVVVDNATPEGPPDVPGWVRLVRADRNLGFGAGCNLGFSGLAPFGVAHVAFLNPDVRLQAPTLTELSKKLDEQPRVGIATTSLVDQDGQPVPSAWGPPSLARALWAGTGWRLRGLRRSIGRRVRRGASVSGASMTGRVLDVDGHVVGGAMLVRAKCFEQLGGFDEGFFLFGEDADLCHRARGLGWQVRVLPAPPMVHLGGSSSTGTTDRQRWGWYLASQRLLYERHVSRFRARMLLCALRVGALLRTRRMR